MFQRTNEQIKAIQSDGKNVMVSASAGAGKTSVMIERAVKLVIEGKAEVKDLLCVTFSNLAAREMKDRLQKEITVCINEDRNAALMRIQLGQLPTSSICTFHSFCNELLKEYFFELGLDSEFGICVDYQCDQLKNSAINDVFEDLYAKNDSDFQYLLRVFFNNRSDKTLKEVLLFAHEKLVSESDYEAVLNTTLNNFTSENFDKMLEQFTKYTLDKLSAELDDCKEKYDESIDLGLVQYAEYFNKIIAELSKALIQTDFFTLSDICAIIASDMNLPKVQTKDELIIAFKDKVKFLRDNLKKFLLKISGTFLEDRETECKKFCYGKIVFEKFRKVLELFSERYALLKKEENLLDFNDLEHKTLELLKIENVRNAIKERYKYIFADEYQDTNGVQEAILRRIENNNLFMVGDVKQSIYAFRGCNPLIFAEKFAKIKSCGGEEISLNENFRSSDAVLSAVNGVFSQVMFGETGDVDYEKNQMKRGGLYPENSGKAVLHILTANESEPQEYVEQNEEESDDTVNDGVLPLNIDGVYSVEKHLNSLKKRTQKAEYLLILDIISDAIKRKFFDLKINAERKIEFSDIAVISRTTSGNSSLLVEALIQNGVPVSSEVKQSILVYPEIKLLTSVLEVIDNSEQDIPLCAVLKSPIGNLDENDLAAIRIFANDNELIGCPFYTAVGYFIENGKSELREKLLKFYKYLDNLCVLSAFLGASEILSKVISDCSLDLYFLKKSFGEERMRRVERFLQEGEQKEKRLTLREFLDRLKSGKNESLTVSSACGDNTVKFMSIHSSKGLEFPVVIIPSLSKKFNFADEKKEVLFDRQYGFAFKNYNIEEKIEAENILREVVKINMRRNAVFEEMRILYVAMTRAKYELHLIVDEKCPNKIKKKRITDALCLRDLVPSSAFTIIDKSSPSSVTDGMDEKREPNLGIYDENLKEELKKNFQFIYPYEKEVDLVVKSSVTRLNDELSGENTRVLFPEDEEKTINCNIPKGTITTDDFAADGTAYHRFLELINFENSSYNELEAQMNTFVVKGLITQTDSERIDLTKIEKLLKQSVFHKINAKYYREKQFFVNIPYRELGVESDENCLVQGVIDLLIIDSDGAIVVDYKYSKKTADKLVDSYRGQLNLYANAIERVCKIKVKNKYLLNLNGGEPIEIKS